MTLRCHTQWIKEGRPLEWKRKRVPRLTPRQGQVLKGYWQGETVQETAERLGISARTVELHRERARYAMASPSMMLAVRTAMQHKLLDNVKGR